jgi:dihydrofolate reductase
MISIIVAVSDDWGIGSKNELLWHIPEDMKRFRKLTMGNTVIMGKKTWESLPKRPLAGRRNIVLTDIPGEVVNGSDTAYSIEDAIGKSGNDGEVFIIGGGTIYRQFMEVADRLYITHVHRNAPADVYFPVPDPGRWEIVESNDFVTDDENRLPYSYVIYERKKG